MNPSNIPHSREPVPDVIEQAELIVENAKRQMFESGELSRINKIQSRLVDAEDRQETFNTVAIFSGIAAVASYFIGQNIEPSLGTFYEMPALWDTATRTSLAAFAGGVVAGSVNWLLMHRPGLRLR